MVGTYEFKGVHGVVGAHGVEGAHGLGGVHRVRDAKGNEVPKDLKSPTG